MDDVYAIARSLIADYGDNAFNQVQEKILIYTNTQNFNALKAWYEIEEAMREMRHTAA